MQSENLMPEEPIPSPAAAPTSIGEIVERLDNQPLAPLDADMQIVLDTLTRLGAQPLEYCSPTIARRQPGFQDALAAIVARQGREASPATDLLVEDLSIPNGDAAPLAARLYRPAGLADRNNPVVLFFHGGGFVTGDLATHEGTAQALARRSGAIVLSATYRLVPEHPFPAAHDDAWTIWRWLVSEAHQLGGDPGRMAVAGEDAGANLAANIALRSHQAHSTQPRHQLLIHPMAGIDLATPSYAETLRTRPFGAAAMRWRWRHLVANPEQRDDPRLNLVSRDDLSGIAPASIVLAAIDPLRSEGEALAAALERASVPLTCQTYEGVTQGFFGLGAMVTKAMFAQSDAAEALRRALEPGPHL
jgi:acetyl esterase